MNKTTIFSLIFCAILIGALAFFYFTYDKKEVSLDYSNISISAEFNNQKIKTGFIVETIDGTIEGNTSQSYEKVIVRNGLVKIYNKNLNGQNFYTDSKEINISSLQRIDLKLQEAKNITVDIISTEPLIIDLKSSDARDIDFCLTWSLNYIFVKSNEFAEIEKRDGWEKCYRGNFSLKDSNQTIQIEYSKFGTPNGGDYIHLLLINNAVESKNLQIVKIL